MESQNNKIKSFILFLIAFTLAVYFMLLTGCATEKKINYHNKQAARHVKKALKLGYEPRADTVYILDTLIQSEIRHDTTFVDVAGDTVTFIKDRLEVKYVRFADSVFIEAECKADTVIKRVPYTVQKTVYLDKGFFDYLGITAWWHWVLFWLFAILVLALILWRLIK